MPKTAIVALALLFLMIACAKLFLGCHGNRRATIPRTVNSGSVAGSTPPSHATFVPAGGQGGCQNPSQPYSITNRPPATCPFYSNNPVSLSPWPLPIDINTAPSEKAVNGDVIGRNAFLGAGQISESYAENYPFTNWATPGSDDYGRAMYYAQPDDPYFNLSPTGSSGQSCLYTHNINGPAFRAPNQAPYTNTYRTDYGSGGADSGIRLFDPSSNVIAGGYSNWSSYTSNLLVGSSTAQSPMGTKMNVGSGCGLGAHGYSGPQRRADARVGRSCSHVVCRDDYQ